jgi:DNA-binding GntR family transcriptional regulator
VASWLDHLSDQDLALLARAAGRSGAARSPARLRAEPHLVEALLAGDSAKARSIMREHVLDFQREIIAAFSRG